MTLTHANWSAVDVPEFHDGFEAALQASMRRLPVAVHGSWIDGVARASRATFGHRSPADTDVVLGALAPTTDAEVDGAVVSAARAQRDWSRMPVGRRVEWVRRLGDLIARERFIVMAALTLEIGKNRFEAATEVEEALSLIGAYSKEVADSDGLTVAFPPLDDESNVSVMRPYGVWAVMGPFNFPFALSVGSAVAALLMGNTVVIKSPESAPVSTLVLGRLAAEAGIPDGVLQIVSGGANVGRALTAHPDIAGVAFVGSYEVGTAIRRVLDGRPCIAEMGGKNATIVSATGDVAIAVPAVARSAFRYSGQKCSATSRVYLCGHDPREFAAALIEQSHALHIGVPWRRSSDVGPLINAGAVQRYRAALAAATDAGATVLTGPAPGGDAERGFFVSPVVLTGLPNDHPLLRNEIFAPVVCIQQAEDVADAVARANDVPFGLTAGFYGTHDADIAEFLDGIEAGVAYVNRVSGSTTGAWVGYQSFGGWKGSGSTNVNAHGPYYVQQFAREQSRTAVGPAGRMLIANPR